MDDYQRATASPFQGSLSYTTILRSHSFQGIGDTVVQFRTTEQDLAGIAEAHRIHGSMVPLVTFRGMCKTLYVYSSPFVQGKPYISVLMIMTRGAKVNNNHFDFCSSLDSILHTVNDYAFTNPTLQRRISTYLIKLSVHLSILVTLPIVLTHQDLAPFNYLIDESSGHVQAVLDWDGALYLPVGSNFHFIESLFGFMTPTGWQDTEDRQELEDAFFQNVLAALNTQGFYDISINQLKAQRAVGMLQYGTEQLLKFKDERAERYLESYIRLSSFMDDDPLVLSQN
ncbi:hypothetical protein F4805DRAFT_478704 [Annulohypoxylon moriforme]|nr:hypothetical protein F4805DRAFT_478704 [Annulohypoxylon moriforme]